jgi:alpha-tubulin suppressor-like RCC1 family protein
VEGLPKAKDVAVGLDFACAVTTAGKVMCWGRNELGQLGHNPANDDSCGEPCNARPTEVAGISNAKGVAAGRWNACAWTEAGALYCWGRNDEGVVGNGRFSNPVYTATAVTGLGSGVIDVALNLSGLNHACAITSAGAAYCWGANNLMQLGHANTNDPACLTSKCNPTPQQVAGITDAVDVFTTDAVSCVVTRAQTVMCWGFEGNGGLGVLNPGGPTPRRVPVLPEMLNGSGFRLHLCGRSSLSDAWCWGPNGKGQLGDGTITGGFSGHACNCKPPSQTVPAMRVRSIAAGDEFTLAAKLDGTVWAWGFNPDGRIGHMPMTQGDLICADSSVCNPVPKQIMGLP